MFNPVSTLLFIINILFHFLFPFSNTNPSGDDKTLIALIRNDQTMQISEYSKQRYEAYLGMVYFMKKNWQCDEIGKGFEEYERTECQKYRKYLDFLYEYLIREYVGIPTVKPKFVIEKRIEIEGPIIYVVNCLVKISQFYFVKWRGPNLEHKLNRLFVYYFEPKLLNEKRLHYGVKLVNEKQMPINEMILQLAIETANNYKTNESLEEIIKENCGEKFEQYLEEMFKKAEEKAKKEIINDDKHFIIHHTEFCDQQWTWITDALFTEFVKGLATNFNKFFMMAKEYLNYLRRRIQIGFTIPFEFSKMLNMKEYFTQKYEALLGIIYVTRKNWHCYKIGKEFEERCQKHLNYLDILYEYLFRIYAKAKSPKVSEQLPPLVKPLFIKEYVSEELIAIIETLNSHSISFWGKVDVNFKVLEDNNNNNVKIQKIQLKNEKELIYEIKKVQNWENSSTKNKKEVEIANLRKEFEQKMKQMYEDTKEKVIKANTAN